jgi:hypothetical protein
MVSDALRARIEAFISRVTSEYIPQEDLSDEGVQYVRDRYFQRLVDVGEDRKGRVLQQLDQSWAQNADHTARGDWGGAAVGIARYLLMPSTMGELVAEQHHTADVLVRLTRWYFTEGNLRARFRSVAQTVVPILFGGEIEDLAQHFGRHR